MRRSRLTIAATFLTFSLAALRSEGQQAKAPDAASNAPAFTKDIRPLLQTYCFECHNPAKRRGGLDLEKIDKDATALDLAGLWDRVGERLTGQEMPPPKSRQPAETERQLLLAWVKHVAQSQVSCDRLTQEQLTESLAGHTGTRRLNRAEYNNTLRDLFGVDLHPGDLLPSEGGGGEGFDNAGATLFITPVLVEKYLEAAELVLATLLPPASAPGRAPAAGLAGAAELAAVRRRLLSAVPGPDLSPHEAARAVLQSFLPRAFRRPVTAREVERYLGVFDKADRRGLPYDQAMKGALKAVLVAPSFLFVTETPPQGPGVYQLDHYEVATHLSYFLWASMPDAELTRLASQRQLHDPGVVQAQVRRMTRDPRARGLADGFAAQWLGIRALGTTIRPDAKLFPEFTEGLAAAMREETLLFFDAIVREDRSVLEILDARYTFVNEPLAALYQIKGVQGPRMRRVPLDDPRRGGVLGQASVLTVTSYPHRTSPVLRGRWILEELLGTDVPPPPPDVPVLNEKGRSATSLTFRQRLEQHRSKAECASCHSRMDPLGFGLENFDPLGRWRSEVAGKAIDSAGRLPTGEGFGGPAELKKLLLEKRRPEFLRNLARKMLGYALAREVNRVDMCVVRDCVQALERGGFRSSRLLETVVLSYPFSHRYREE
jgi:hypothetical protein